MSDQDNGGPAFPVSTVNGTFGHQDSAITWQYPGMSLRDYFAANAPACPDDYRKRYATGGFIPEHPTEREARWRWAYADAMLAARSKT